jgi:hypothetical protein
MLFVLATVVAIATFYFSVPMMRAKQFANYVRSGQRDKAEAMWPGAASEAIDPNYRQVLRLASVANVQPITFDDVWKGQRRVVVGKGWGGGDAEFIVSTTTVTTGGNWFNYF